MYNNPDNLTTGEYAESYVREHDQVYRIFAVSEVRRCGLYYVLYRLVWDREGNISILEDFAWHFSESPDWITRSA